MGEPSPRCMRGFSLAACFTKDYLDKLDKHLVCDRMLMEGRPAHTWESLFSQSLSEPGLEAGNSRFPSSNRPCRFSGVSGCFASNPPPLYSGARSDLTGFVLHKFGV